MLQELQKKAAQNGSTPKRAINILPQMGLGPPQLGLCPLWATTCNLKQFATQKEWFANEKFCLPTNLQNH